MLPFNAPAVIQLRAIQSKQSVVRIFEHEDATVPRMEYQRQRICMALGANASVRPWDKRLNADKNLSLKNKFISDRLTANENLL
jgi:hypothetical protein